MKVYKYVSADALKKILSGQRIGFSHPSVFNDPFDRPWISEEHFPFEYVSLIDQRLMSRARQKLEAERRWGEYSISSFTRTYDNVLMWAHYAEKHKGACIEFDTTRANLTGLDLLIPIQFGSVIYVNRPDRPLPNSVAPGSFEDQLPRSGDNRFDIENYERLQRLFLTKPISWSYEEEVRVIASPAMLEWHGRDETISGDWAIFRDNNGGLLGHGLRMSSGAITRVFTGLRFPDSDRNLLRSLADRHGFTIMNASESATNGYALDFIGDDPELSPLSRSPIAP